MNYPTTNIARNAASLTLLQPLANNDEDITDEVRQLLQRLAHDQQGDVIDIEPAAPNVDVQTALVLYNPFSLDSLMAAAMLTACSQKFDVSTQAHHYIDTKVSVGKAETLISVGMELNQDLLTALLENNPNLKLVLAGYRDSYQWLEKTEYVYRAKKWYSDQESGFFRVTTQSALFKKHSDRIKLLRPSDDYYGALITKTDNTLTKVVQFWLATLNQNVKHEWRELCELVSRMYGMSSPLTGFLPEEEAAANMATDAANRVKLHELSVKLRAAMGAHKPQEKLKEMELTPNLDNYRAHKAMMEEMFARSMHDQNLQAAVGSSHRVRMAQMSENVVNDLIALPSIASKDVVFYTDVKRFRVWRVYSPNHGKAEAIAACFKPVATWSEGMFVCALTYISSIVH